MNRNTKFGAGLAAFVAVGLAWSATQDEATGPTAQQRAAVAQAQTRARLTQLAPAKRRDIDYAALDARFRRVRNIARPSATC